MDEKKYIPHIQLFADEGSFDGDTGEIDAGAEQSGTDGVDLEKEFSELIGGKFKEQFTEKTQGIINKRFKQTKLLEDYKNRVSPAVDMLMKKYGIEEGCEDRLAEIIGAQEENGEKAREEISQRSRRLGERAAVWIKESAQMKELYPDFDLRKELGESELFSKLVLSGAPVRAAYETVHRDEILSGAMAYTADRVREQVVRNIETKGRRPLENGISSESAVVTAVDVNSLTSKDILRILKQVENGASIKF